MSANPEEPTPSPQAVVGQPDRTPPLEVDGDQGLIPWPLFLALWIPVFAVMVWAFQGIFGGRWSTGPDRTGGDPPMDP